MRLATGKRETWRRQREKGDELPNFGKKFRWLSKMRDMSRSVDF